MLKGTSRGVLVLIALVSYAVLISCGGNTEEQATGDGSWPAAQGVTDDQILLGTHYPLSNTPAAVYANSLYAMEAYFDYINDQGGINGRKIKLIVEDDQFTPPRD